MIMMMLCSVIAMIMAVAMMIICIGISTKSMADREKSSPFECGFDPSSSPRMPFSIQFYLIAILFMVFDVEIAIIIPMIITSSTHNMWNWLMIMLMFITILTSGLYYEWKNGVLKWMN